MGATAAKTVTIANGTAVSGAVDLERYTLAAIVMPAAWTAANLTFQASNSLDGTYQDLYDDGGTEVTVTAAQARVLTLKSLQDAIAPIRFLKIRSGTSAVPVNQGAERKLTILLKER